MNEINVHHFSRFREKKDKYQIHDFCIFIYETAEVLSKISEVQYILHPSFWDPIRSEHNPQTCFALFGDAWGNFPVELRVRFSDRPEVRINHNVTLERDDWPKGPVLSEFSSPEAEFIYKSLVQERTEWRKISTLVRRIRGNEDDAEAALQMLEYKRAVRRNPNLSIDMQELWGATARVGIMPEPKHA